jgi:arylsulfatase A-like enzyme
MKPNILFLMCDQLRGDALGCSGNPAAETPHLDFLASRGTVFERAYSACPSCLPARASLWTGLDQYHTGILGMGSRQPQLRNTFARTLAGELTRGGYQTMLVGKGHFHPHREAMGFEKIWLDESGRKLTPDFVSDYRAWFKEHAPAGTTPDDHGVEWNSWLARPWHLAEELHPTAWTVTQALEAVKTRDPGRPLFLNVSFARPHSPYVPPDYFFQLHRQNPLLPEPWIGDWCECHRDPVAGLHTEAWQGDIRPDRVRRGRAGYYGEVSFIDSRIGHLLTYLRLYHPEFWSNCWIVFTSDHGDMLGDHHLWRKTYAYEGSTHIPLFVVPPAAAPAAVRRDEHHVAELRDLMPTVLEMAGLPAPDYLDGASLLPFVRGEETPWRRWLHGEHCTCYAPEQEMQFVTDGAVKFVWLPRIGVEQFFDLVRDPGECRNLIADPAYADRAAEARRELIDQLAARRCGWCEDGKLSAPKTILHSKWAETPYTGQE